MPGTAQTYKDEAHLVCVTPNDLTFGSRAPPSKTPWIPSAGSVLGLNRNANMAVAAVVGWMLAL